MQVIKLKQILLENAGGWFFFISEQQKGPKKEGKPFLNRFRHQCSNVILRVAT